MSDLDTAVKLIKAGRRFLLTCHVLPDADALGSMLGLSEILKSLGKEVVLYNRDPVPPGLQFLAGAAEVRSSLVPGMKFDATLITDTAARDLLPRQFPPPAITGPVIIIDHHVGHDDFGDVVLRDVNAAATAVVVADLAAALGLSTVPVAAAEPLYTCLLYTSPSPRDRS